MLPYFPLHAGVPWLHHTLNSISEAIWGYSGKEDMQKYHFDERNRIPRVESSIQDPSHSEVQSIPKFLLLETGSGELDVIWHWVFGFFFAF